MADEPARLEGDFQSAMKLVGADASLSAGHQVECLQPQVQSNVAGLENGADLNVELLATDVALVKADAGALALHLGNTLGALAVGAHRAVG